MEREVPWWNLTQQTHRRDPSQFVFIFTNFCTISTTNLLYLIISLTPDDELVQSHSIKSELRLTKSSIELLTTYSKRLLHFLVYRPLKKGECNRTEREILKKKSTCNRVGVYCPSEPQILLQQNMDDSIQTSLQ